MNTTQARDQHVTTASVESLSFRISWMVIRLLWLLAGVLEFFLGLRFFLRLFNANALAPFTRFVYGITTPFVQPFLSVFRVTLANIGIFEWPTILAMIMYGLIALLLVKFIQIIAETMA